MRKIIHIDMDAFFAAVEIRDNPALRGKPVVVGGLPGTRSVVCTASYEARKFGIHSAMSSDRAAALCPHAIFIRPDRVRYRQASDITRNIFADYTDLVEPVSIDEAYLDVTVCKKELPYATRIAKEIRRRIFRETGGLTASAGISYNKFLAKMASDIKKPNGQTVILPEQAPDFLAALPIEKFHGIGKATAKIMHRHGIRNGADLLRKTKLELIRLFGSYGMFYYNIVRGIDEREVCPDQERKSLGVEETFQEDITDVSGILYRLRLQCGKLAQELKDECLRGKTVSVKVKYFDFRTITRARTLNEYTDAAEVICRTAQELLTKTDMGQTAIRLLGVTVSGFPGIPQIRQMEFDFMKTIRPVHTDQD